MPASDVKCWWATAGLLPAVQPAGINPAARPASGSPRENDDCERAGNREGATMNPASDIAALGRRRSAWLLGFLLLLSWGALPQSTAAGAPLVRAHAAAAQATGTATGAIGSGNAGANSNRQLEAVPTRRAGLIDYVLGSRTRMIQIATLALLLGLFILMRK